MGTVSPALPLHRTIVVVDVEGSTRRLNPAKARLRRAMYDLLEKALRTSGIAEEHHDRLIDRGDGALVLVHPVDEVPKTLLLTTFIPSLGRLLASHGAHGPDHGIRLRTALHAGEVHYDERGPFGEAIDLTCRLLDAPELRTKLSETAASLVLVVSEDIYRGVIRHGYEGIDDQAFEPLVTVELGEYPHRGWVYVPATALPVFDVHPRSEPSFGRQYRDEPIRHQA
jgi:class 3 adenylate cyclase